MNKREIRLQLIKYKENLKQLRYVYVEEEKDRQWRDIQIIKQKIKLLEKELKK